MKLETYIKELQFTFVYKFLMGLTTHSMAEQYHIPFVGKALFIPD
jgi:hypothetical protein